MIALLATLAALLVAALPAQGRTTSGLPASWVKVSSGPAGGSVWQGNIPDQFVSWDHRSSAVYLPPGYTATHRYPVVYLLHGMRGAPSSFWAGLHFATVADELITSGRSAPFIAVMPVAGPRVNPDGGEWAGVWEQYVVQDVVPWVDTHLPTLADRRDRALEGLCAGGYGAIDIGLRHPTLFGTLGSWEGYFAPVFRDGPFVRATTADLDRHDPTLLVKDEAPQLRVSGTRFYVSVGGNHGHVLRIWSLAFDRELQSLQLSQRLWLLPRAERGHFWSATLPSALTYAADGFGPPPA